MTENHCSDWNIQASVRSIRIEMDEAARQYNRDPSEIRLMAVTKTRTPLEVNAAVAAGITLLGENKAQELCARYDQYHLDGCEIHFIGTLQTNKVRQIIDKVTMIESVDSVKLAGEISRQCVKHGLTMDILLEINIGREDSKGGFMPEELEDAVRKISQLPAVQIKGLMTIPPVCDNSEQSRDYFEQVHGIFVDMQSKNIDNVNMEVLSMGMSDDYREAISCGTTVVRIGTAMFGPRNYNMNRQ